MKIIPRYIFNELLAPFSLSLIAFTFVILINKIIRLTELIVNKGVGLWSALTLFSYILPAFLVLAIPCTVLLASQVAFGRLSSDNETTALFANGLSVYQLMPPVAMISVFAFSITLLLMLFAVPHANKSFSDMLNHIGHQMVQSSSALNLKERVFVDEFSDMVIYVDKIPPGGSLEGVLISNYRQSKEPQIITARRGNIIPHSDGSLKVAIVLEDGTIQNFTKPDKYRKIDFDSYELQIDLSTLVPRSDSDKRKREMTVSELLAGIEQNKGNDKISAPFEVELHKRFALPFSCLLLGFLGAPLGIQRARGGGKSAGFIFSITVIFIYYILLRTGESMGEAGKIYPALAMWLPNLILAGIVAYVLRKAAHQSPIKLVEWLTSLNEAVRGKLKALGKLLD